MLDKQIKVLLVLLYGTNGSFYWIVYAERLKIEIEPDKKDVELKGDGPYTYIEMYH